ncbi:hypothetical protein ACF08M_39660 [Streptomyces sp. NPDC015032]|uniref:hypothetical protein n=1 Tax=Streptomyces sp. NPDC015032 TaxID=3364937 RepID=UPI0036F93703
MTPLPGPPPGNAPPRTRPGTATQHIRAQAARRLFVAVLLAVLTVVGGAPAAAGSVPLARPFAGVPPSAAYSPGAQQPTPHTDRTARTGTVHDTRRTRTAAATDRGRPPPPAPQPRAGADHARTAHHLPPPGHCFLLPGAPGIRVPHHAHRRAPSTSSRSAGHFRVALPGVRGPPGTAVYRPPVLPPVPSHRHAVPSSPR